MNAPFSIGQEVVCIKTHSENEITKGDEFIVLGMKQCPDCKMWWVDVGRTNPFPKMSICGCGRPDEREIISWFGAPLFAPITRARTVYVAEYIKEQELILS